MSQAKVKEVCWRGLQAEGQIQYRGKMLVHG